MIAYHGPVATEAISAAGTIGQDRRDVGVLAVTSADRLNPGCQAAKRARSRERRFADSQMERLLAPLPPHNRIITVIGGHPATLSWLGDVRGHIVASLGVEHFGQSGTETDLCRHYGLNRGSIAATAQMVSPGPPVRQQPSAEYMSAARPRELVLGGPDGQPGYAMPCLCDEFSGEDAAPQFADRPHVLVEPDFNEGPNPGFASGLSEN